MSIVNFQLSIKKVGLIINIVNKFMTRFTIFIYLFFKKNKSLFYTILLSTTLLFAFLSLKIEFEEDISKLLPSVDKGGAEKLVFSNLKVKDKVFVLFNPKSDDVYPEDLITVCDEFIRSLMDKDTVYNAIDNILYRIDEDLFQNGIQFLYENIPSFIDSSGYRQLDMLLVKEHIEKQMSENYATLISPAGAEYKDIITHDPIAIRNIFMSEMGNISNGLGGNYTFYDGHIFSSDTSALIAFVSPSFKSFDSKKGTRLVEMIEENVEAFKQQNPEIEILFHGGPVQSVYNSKRIKTDLLLTISVSLIFIFILLLVCFKNKTTLFHLVVPVVYGIIFSLAVIYLVKGSMSLMAMGIGAIVMGVAFSYCLHIITHYKYVSSPKRVLQEQTVPLVLGVLTTIGAFMGLLLTKSELLQDFGLFASLGLAGTTVFCLLFLPQFFNPKTNRRSEKAFAVLEKINSYPFEKQKWLIALILIISVVCFVASDEVKFDSDLKNIGYHNERVVRSQDLLASTSNDNLSTVYFAAVSENLDSALIYGGHLCRKLDKAKEKNQIKGYSTTYSLFIPIKEQEERIKRWNEYWTDEKMENLRHNIAEAGSKHKFNQGTFAPFFDMLEAEYEPVPLYDAEIIPKEIQDNIIEFTDNSYLVFIPVQMNKENLEDTGSEIIEGHPNLIVIDPMYYTSDMVKMIHNDFDTTLAISSLFVLAVLLISFRSIALAFMAFLPMGLSWYIVLGCMSLFGMEFNLINIVISAFIFGLGDDYSIFIMDGLLARYRTRAPLLVYHKTAIFFSAVILIIVVSSLLFAVHPAISSIGVSTLIGMGATILIAYSLQPFIFSLLITNRIEKGKDPISIAGLFSKKGSLIRKLKNNYVYKDYVIENALDQELKKTNNYALISEAVKGKGNMIDFGCGYGFTSYHSSIVNKEINIVGFDVDSEEISLADNCYQKTEMMRFTSEYSVLNDNYDVVIINKVKIVVDEEIMQQLFTNAQTVIIRKDMPDKYNSMLDRLQFKKAGWDKIFVIYKGISKNSKFKACD